MAPEHVSGKPVPASDIFSLGVIAFEMLTANGRSRRNSHSLCVNSKRKESPQGAIRHLRPELPREAENAIRAGARLRTLRERPANAREFCDTIGLSLETDMSPVAARSPRGGVAEGRGGRSRGD